MTDYRSHLSVTIWAALVALALGAFLQIPERSLSLTFLGSPVSVTLTSNTLVGLVAMTVVCAGMEAALRTHPKPELLRHTYRYWGLPSATVLAGAAILPALPTSALWVAALALTGLALAIVTLAEYHTVDPDDLHNRSARLVLNLMAYGVAAVVFILVYGSRSRSLISATTIGVMSGLLALDLLHGSQQALRYVALYSFVVAIILAQSTWVLNYWPFASMRVGLVLLVGFYLLVGLAQQALHEQLTRFGVFVGGGKRCAHPRLATSVKGAGAGSYHLNFTRVTYPWRNSCVYHYSQDAALRLGGKGEPALLAHILASSLVSAKAAQCRTC